MPVSASRRAKASPIPDEAPVTTAHGPNLATKFSIVDSIRFGVHDDKLFQKANNRLREP
jgi:hypothetical protein